MATKPTYEELEQRVERLEKKVAKCRQTAAALKKSEEKYRKLLTEMNDGFIVTDERGTLTFINNVGAEMHGYENPGELVGRNILEFISPEARVEIMERIHRAVKTGEFSGVLECPTIRKDGSTIFIQLKSGPIIEEGRIAGTWGIMGDITKLKRAEGSLREVENIFNLFMEHSPIYMFFKDKDFRAILLSRNYEQMLGRPIDELLGKTMDELYPCDLAKSMIADDLRIINGGKPVTVEEEFNGRFYETTKFPIHIKGEPKYLAGFTIDITERVQTEEALRNSEVQKKAILDGITTNLAFVNENFDIQWLNKASANSVNRSPEEMIGRKCHEFWGDSETPCNGCPVDRAFKTKKTEQAITYGPDGRIWDEKGDPVFNDHGEIIGVIEIAHDITDKVKTEEALSKSESLIRNVTDNIPVVIFELYAQPDNVFGLYYVSRRAEELFGISNELEGFFERFVERIPTKREQEAFVASIGEAAKNFERWDYTTRFKKPNGELILLQGNSSPEKMGDEMVFRGMLSDVTEVIKAEEENKSLQAKLQRSQKMESLGLLAGGVAHDLNNILSGIINYPELLLLDMPEDSPLRRPIETMRESGYRAAAVVQDLLTMARGVATTKEPLNLNDIISEYLNSPEFEKLDRFHPLVTIKTNLDTDLFNVTGSHIHIRKVVMNLVSNASEAIEGSGKVRISTMNRYVDRHIKGYDNVAIGEYAIIAVSDDGSGISFDDLERIFDPFYTKKVLGRSGTGLGLAVVWNVMQDHQGYIDVITDENGTTFELYFPITRDEISDRNLSTPIEEFKGDGETILVVDDVKSQREISCWLLDALGYKSKAVPSGEEAVEYLKENTIDLVLLDMIMDPGINGRKTYERIIEIHPKQKAIIVSGFVETDEVKEAQKLGAGEYIKKPYTIEKIGFAVKKELER